MGATRALAAVTGVLSGLVALTPALAAAPWLPGVSVSADQMALHVEGVVDRSVGGKESLRRGLGFEPLLLAFSSSDRQVGVLNAVVFPQPARPVWRRSKAVDDPGRPRGGREGPGGDVRPHFVDVCSDPAR